MIFTTYLYYLMKKSLFFFVVLLLIYSVNLAAGFKNVIKVNNLESFVEALQDNTHIIITTGSLDISGLTLHFYLDKNAKVSRSFEDFGMLISKLKNVKISGQYFTELYTTDPYERVLELTACENIQFENINFLHKPKSDIACMGEVIYLQHSSNIVFKNCHFNGSGTVGLSMDNVQNIRVSNSNFYNNSQNLIIAYNASDVIFNEVDFYNNDLKYSAIFVNNSSIEFHSCTFEDNIIGERFLSGNCIGNEEELELYFEHCTIRNNKISEEGKLYQRLTERKRALFTTSDIPLLCEEDRVVEEIYHADNRVEYAAEVKVTNQYDVDDVVNDYYVTLSNEIPELKNNIRNYDVGALQSKAFMSAIDNYLSRGKAFEYTYKSGNIEKMYYILALYYHENAKNKKYLEHLQNVFSFPLRKYWNHQNFTQSQLINEYTTSWERLVASVNLIHSIHQINENEMEVVVDYYFITKKTKNLQHVRSTIRYQFDGAKIKSVFPVR